MEGQVPELLLGRRGQDPLADAGQRWCQYQRLDQVRAVSGDGLRDPAADVVTAEDRLVQPEFFNQRDDTAGLRVSAVLDRRVAQVFVGRAKAAQVGHHNVGRWQERATSRYSVGRPAIHAATPQPDQLPSARTQAGTHQQRLFYTHRTRYPGRQDRQFGTSGCPAPADRDASLRADRGIEVLTSLTVPMSVRRWTTWTQTVGCRRTGECHRMGTEG